MKKKALILAALPLFSLVACGTPSAESPASTEAPIVSAGPVVPESAIPSVAGLTALEEVLLYQDNSAGELEHEYVSAELASAGNTIHAEALKAAETMPAVSVDELPKWRGTSLALDTMLQSEGRSYFAETDIKAISLMGFNFVRVMLDYHEFTDESGGFLYDEKMLENFDSMIGWCIKYGIHASIDIHVAPGYHTDDGTTLMEDEIAYQRCVELWRVLAAR